mmetsp:Transcript_59721/g.99076  ORF Transcript_59721/g.99076 Transcript_59721/m.99076 type:complete len:164 (+) Transcript_59721:18-509(+)|eukprot:CAMPEP_0119310934 /NCGR_PEP_ID=MMETSP1333-20130426/20895_1 /TAXON_ID=418940 /ORGANISM="Scyphosphaera apsteinii, Strain RCC1455" /LENGTH=163 /DNA_ID=CAMNT_0007315203 /DNA_START=6 /DNA_END=497 /DNA_ORIENTATION=+
MLASGYKTLTSAAAVPGGCTTRAGLPTLSAVVGGPLNNRADPGFATYGIQPSPCWLRPELRAPRGRLPMACFKDFSHQCSADDFSPPPPKREYKKEWLALRKRAGLEIGLELPRFDPPFKPSFEPRRPHAGLRVPLPPSCNPSRPNAPAPLFTKHSRNPSAEK